METTTAIRQYRPSDYDQVAQIFQDGQYEVQAVSHQSLYNGKFPQLIASELVAFFGGWIFWLRILKGEHAGGVACGVSSLVMLCSLSLWMRQRWANYYIR